MSPTAQADRRIDVLADAAERNAAGARIGIGAGQPDAVQAEVDHAAYRDRARRRSTLPLEKLQAVLLLPLLARDRAVRAVAGARCDAVAEAEVELTRSSSARRSRSKPELALSTVTSQYQRPLLLPTVARTATSLLPPDARQVAVRERDVRCPCRSSSRSRASPSCTSRRRTSPCSRSSLQLACCRAGTRRCNRRCRPGRSRPGSYPHVLMNVVCDVTQRPEVQSELLSHGSPATPSMHVELVRPPAAQWPESQSLSLEHAEPVMRSLH